MVESTVAMDWFRMAAEQGYARAQYSMGHHYRKGYDIPRDMEQAAVWYQKAAEQGHPEGEFALGNCYRLGEGIAEDKVLAYHWLNAASTHERNTVSGRAREDRDELAIQMTEEEIAEGQSLTEQLLRKNPNP